MKRVLVTGASGFIGRHAVGSLRSRGFEVVALGRTSPPEADAGFRAVDLLDRIAVARVVAGAEASHLLHLAWYAEPGAYWRSPANLDWVSASLHLVRSFAEAGGRRAVVAGTCAEYAWASERLVEATSPCRPATLYGAAKDGLRRILEAYAAAAGLSVGWGRVFFLYGPGEKTGRLVADAARALLADAPFPTSHGWQRRDFLHVRDVAAAFAALLDSDVEGAVNIGSGAAIPVRQVVETIAAEAGHPERVRFGARELPPGEPDVIEADIRRLAEEVGFRPTLPLGAGIADTVAWWREQAVSRA